MTWTLHLQPIRNPWTDEALLTCGRALYVAQAFEQKCVALVRYGHMAEAIEKDPVLKLQEILADMPSDRLLGPSLARLARLLPDAAEHSDTLSVARLARNKIAHESALFGIHSSNTVSMVARLRELEVAIGDLAAGDNLVSTWLFQVEEWKEPYLPTDLIDAYPQMIADWVFKPVRGLLQESEV